MKQLPLSPTLKSTSLYVSSIILMKGISLFMLPYIANHISQSELGRLEFLVTFSMLLSAVLGFSLHKALCVFIEREQDPHKKRKITGEIFTLAMIIGVISLVVIWLSTPFINELYPQYATTSELELLLMPLAFEGMIIVVLNSLRIREKAELFFFLTTGRALLQILLTILFLHQNYGISGILLAGFISAALQICALIYIQTKQNRKVHGTGYLFNKDITALCFPYSLPLLVGGLVAFVLNGGERWILLEHTSFDELAIYSVAIQFALVLTLLMEPFSIQLSQKRINYLQSKGKKSTTKVIETHIVLLCILTTIACYCVPVFIECLMSANYHQAKNSAIALIIVSAIKELNRLINIGNTTEEKTKKILWINTLSILSGLTLLIFTAPSYGINAVLFSLITAQSMQVTLTYILTQHSSPLPYSVGKLTVLFLITGISITLSLSSLPSTVHLVATITSALSIFIFAYQLQLITLPIHKSRK
ncbi:lipopolysaccharide biosynthesis protein [Aliivibrio logei]|uniref:lipopolysaccharide biosynthesis protein n=1 Tax=Aliivibrio logei TaxID=688 RepID=UPI0035C8E3C4